MSKYQDLSKEELLKLIEKQEQELKTKNPTLDSISKISKGLDVGLDE